MIARLRATRGQVDHLLCRTSARDLDFKVDRAHSWGPFQQEWHDDQESVLEKRQRAKETKRQQEECPSRKGRPLTEDLVDARVVFGLKIGPRVLASYVMYDRAQPVA